MLSLIILFALLPFLYPFFIKQKQYDHSRFQNDIAKLQQQQADSTEPFTQQNTNDYAYQPYQQPSENHTYSSAKGELFYFDPNTLSEEGWIKLGVKEKTVQTIKKYTSKGGKFYKAEDIKKIWGLNETLVSRLIPYIKIESNYNNNTKEYPKEQYTYTTNKPINKDTNKPVDINTTDSFTLVSLPGIGPKLSQRIITFREKLGGFYKIEQVGETFGLPDSTFQKIKPKLLLNTNTVKQININIATIDEMKIHPYFKYAVANAIVQYRNQHGNYRSVEDIKKIMTINTELYNKIVPYLKVD